MRTEDVLAMITLIPWGIGFSVALFVQVHRVNARIRARVQATGGRPVSSEYAFSMLAWGGIKALLWPITLVAYFVAGRSRAVPA